VADVVKGQRGLTTERVVDAALRVADEGGMEAVSLRRLARELGVTPMAIYRHVRDKSQLLDLMADRLLEQLEVAPADVPTWQGRLRRLASSLLAVLQAHPAAPFLLSRPFNSPAALRVSEALLGILDQAGFSRQESVRLVQVITGMVLGPAIHRATYAAASREVPQDDPRQQASAEWLSSGNFPYLASAARELSHWSAGADADEFTIELLVSGLEALAGRANQSS
jgi:TetR/AcrR family transcriptional regulator, tetracycline repressor protein